MQRRRIFRSLNEIKDAKGAVHRIRASAWRSADAWRAPESKAALRFAYGLTGSPTVYVLGLTVVILVLLILIGPVILSVLHLQRFFQGAAPWLLIAAALMASATAGREFRHQQRRAIQTLLEQHLCPVCAYDLGGIPSNRESGLTTCPECGAAWRIGEPPGPVS